MSKLATGIVSLSGKGDLTLSWIEPGSSYLLEEENERQISQLPGSSAISADIRSQLFRDVLAWKRLSVTSLPVQVFEVEQWEQIVEKLNALESVAGILNELTAEEATIFEQATKRRPFFE